jgi:hypothetical protein
MWAVVQNLRMQYNDRLKFMNVVGEVMLAKNPSLFPGDIRKVMAKHDERLT